MSAQEKQQVKKSVSRSKIVVASDIGKKIDQAGVATKEFALVVRQLRLNARQGTVGVKGRSDVARSTKKPWKQKGTGRARAGSARSPLWRGGGITFGPQKRTRTLGVPKKVRRTALGGLLSDYLARKNIVALDWQLSDDAPKTAQAVKALQMAKLHGTPITLFLAFDDAVHQRSFANIPRVTIVSFDAPHAFHMVQGSTWVLLKKDLDQFTQMVEKWL